LPFFFFASSSSTTARSRVIFTHEPSTSFTGHDWCHRIWRSCVRDDELVAPPLAPHVRMYSLRCLMTASSSPLLLVDRGQRERAFAASCGFFVPNVLM
jgi:hypothetical protein